MTLVQLLRRDHDDILRALARMLDLNASPTEARDALDTASLGLAVHATAESRLFASITQIQPIPALQWLATTARREHLRQQATAQGLDGEAPLWYQRGIELHETLVEHGSHGDRVAAVLKECLPRRVFDGLAGRYATERLRILGATSPVLLVSNEVVAAAT
jgi:hypothetical protein